MTTRGDNPFYTYISGLKALWDEIAQHRPFTVDHVSQGKDKRR